MLTTLAAFFLTRTLSELSNDDALKSILGHLQKQLP